LNQKVKVLNCVRGTATGMPSGAAVVGQSARKPHTASNAASTANLHDSHTHTHTLMHLKCRFIYN